MRVRCRTCRGRPTRVIVNRKRQAQLAGCVASKCVTCAVCVAEDHARNRINASTELWGRILLAEMRNGNAALYQSTNKTTDLRLGRRADVCVKDVGHSRLATQAQRRRPRGAPIATAPARRSSRQRMLGIIGYVV